jgi:NAD(P)H-hydrate repair Nnr-like enzyme with NAD(P)H-hydrate epimerase domain
MKTKTHDVILQAPELAERLTATRNPQPATRALVCRLPTPTDADVLVCAARGDNRGDAIVALLSLENRCSHWRSAAPTGEALLPLETSEQQAVG